MTTRKDDALLLPFIEIPDDLLNAYKGDSGVLLIGQTGSGKSHVLRRLGTLHPGYAGSRKVFTEDLRGSTLCKDVAEAAQFGPVAALMQAQDADEAWASFSQDAGITLGQAKEVFALIVMVERGKVSKQIHA